MLILSPFIFVIADDGRARCSGALFADTADDGHTADIQAEHDAAMPSPRFRAPPNAGAALAAPRTRDASPHSPPTMPSGLDDMLAPMPTFGLSLRHIDYERWHQGEAERFTALLDFYM